jgi:hypothetical protein
MPRQPRLDAPNTLHHVMVRGIERTAIVRDDLDRADFVARPWQDTTTILAQFGPTVRRARHAYRTFVAAGLPQGRRPELQGGGFVRRLGGWQAGRAPDGRPRPGGCADPGHGPLCHQAPPGRGRPARGGTARHLLAYVWVEGLGRRGAPRAVPWQADIPRWCR